jgi:hypothetical protein
MNKILNIHHRTSHGMCPVNGIRDLVQWRSGRNWSNEFLWGLGQGGGFAYLRFNAANPPRQVYTGISTPRQHKYLAGLFQGGFAESKNRTFKSSWAKAQQAVEAETPPVLGPLDMYHLHYYPELYHRRHIPIHFVLLVGYDDDTAYVHDTDKEAVQAISLVELQLAWDTNVPGLGKRNRLAVIEVYHELPPTEVLIQQAIFDQCQTMLHPPVSMVGIPAMRKLASEIAHWPEELGEVTAARCLRQVREYLNSPPDLEGNHLTAGRDRYIAFLQQAGGISGVDFSQAILYLQESISIIPEIAGAIQQNDLAIAAMGFKRVSDAETIAFSALSKAVCAA